MKVYISGKITGNHDYKREFIKAQRKLESEGYAVINPINIELSESFSYEDYMHIDFACIDVCDALYLLDNWQDSNGAKREVEYAFEKGKVILKKNK